MLLISPASIFIIDSSSKYKAPPALLAVFSEITPESILTVPLAYIALPFVAELLVNVAPAIFNVPTTFIAPPLPLTLLPEIIMLALTVNSHLSSTYIAEYVVETLLPKIDKVFSESSPKVTSSEAISNMYPFLKVLALVIL